MSDRFAPSRTNRTVPGVYFDPDDRTFQGGACHGALWLSTIAQHMAEEGRPTDDLAERLSEMTEVLIEWQNGTVAMPVGPPWHWQSEELDHYISMRKGEW